MWQFGMFVCFVASLAHCAVMEEKYLTKTTGKRHSGTITLTKTVKSDRHCAKICANDDTCFSYNVVVDENGNKRCELISSAVAKVLVDDESASFYEVDWFTVGDSSYLFIPDYSQRWDSADTLCKGMGARLIAMETEEEYDLIDSIIASNYVYTNPAPGDLSYRCYHIDMMLQSGIWRWGDGTQVTYNRWRANQPSNADARNMLQLTSTTNGWNNILSSFKCAAICEKPLP